MGSDYYSEQRRRESDAYIPEIKRLIIQNLLVVASDFMDMRRAADLILLETKQMTIAARVRMPNKGYAEKYADEFTFRAVYENGHVTELDKVLQGMGDRFFYGHGHPDKPGLFILWRLLDLHVFRADIREKSWQTIPNHDGTFFVPFNVKKFPPELVIASGNDLPVFQPSLF